GAGRERRLDAAAGQRVVTVAQRGARAAAAEAHALRAPELRAATARGAHGDLELLVVERVARLERVVAVSGLGRWLGRRLGPCIPEPARRRREREHDAQPCDAWPVRHARAAHGRLRAARTHASCTRTVSPSTGCESTRTPTWSSERPASSPTAPRSGASRTSAQV